MNLVILGVSGMLGHAMFRVLSKNPNLRVFGTARSARTRSFFSPVKQPFIYEGMDITDFDALVSLFSQLKPQVVINCIGLIKQLKQSKDPIPAISINALFPHRLASFCQLMGARLIHFSTDCVFSGSKGNYCESDPSDAQDLYGKSKFLGEVDYPHALTLRTSIIGQELQSHHSLLGWFLKQEGSVKGYKKAIFSGLPTIELARIVDEFILPRPELSGIYHVAAEPISKYELLGLIAKTYQKSIEIIPDESVKIDRSLNAERFYETTGYRAPRWTELLDQMVAFS